jgi:hypothetical protein
MKIVKNIFHFVSTNSIASALVVAVILGALAWLNKWRKDRRDSNKIYQFLIGSAKQTSFQFRSTEAISSDTGIPEDRVANLCSRNKKIKRNEKEKQSWRLVE